jgi:hypothetical protein
MEDAPAAARLMQKARVILAATHNHVSRIMRASRNSELHCLQEGSVSFCARAGIDPVGASRYPNSEMPP